MRLRRGFFRIWIVLSVLWIGTVSAIQISDLRSSRLYYQYSVQLFAERPWEADWNAPFYERTKSPSAEHLSPTFSQLEWQYVSDWKQSVQRGTLQEITFPDATRLFLDSQWNEADAQYLSRHFWDQRWARYLDRSKGALMLALGLPIALLVLGAAAFWIASGFKAGPPKPATPA